MTEQEKSSLTQEERDLMERNTKKVKLGQIDGDLVVEDEAMEHVREENPPQNPLSTIEGVSYKDKVMSLMGSSSSEELLKPEEIVQIVTEDVFPESRVDNDKDSSMWEFNPKPNVNVSVEEYEQWCRPWKNTLIVRLRGKRTSLRFMSNKLQNLWAKHGSIHVLDMHNDFFIVRFSDEGDYKHAIYEGRWHFLDHYLLVQRWRPLFDTSDHKIQKVAVWIRIPNLPLELYNDHFLWRVGSKLGTMLKIDNLTSVHSRGKFA